MEEFQRTLQKGKSSIYEKFKSSYKSLHYILLKIFQLPMQFIR